MRWLGFIGAVALSAIGATWIGACGKVESAPSRGSCGTSVTHACGADGGDDCCRVIEVPAGTITPFAEVNETYGFANARASLSAFRLDTYEVTVGRFRSFVDAFDGWQPEEDAGARTAIASSGWQPGWPLAPNRASLTAAIKSCHGGTWTDAPADNETKPMTCLTWYELFAFCVWDHGHLPTMTEHGYVAYGGDELRRYPWSAPDASTISDEDAIYTPEGGASRDGPERVGSRPAGEGKWGEADLAGNAEEWVLDAYPPFPYPGGRDGCIDCAVLDPQLTTLKQRVILGGSFRDDEHVLQSFYMRGADPMDRQPTRGGRCGR